KRSRGCIGRGGEDRRAIPTHAILLEFAALADDQIVHWSLSRLPVIPQPEPLLQQTLNHHANLLKLSIPAARRRDIPAARRHPARRTRYPRREHVVSPRDQHAEGAVARSKLTAPPELKPVRKGIGGRMRANRCNFEGSLPGRGLVGSTLGHHQGAESQC